MTFIVPQRRNEKQHLPGCARSRVWAGTSKGAVAAVRVRRRPSKGQTSCASLQTDAVHERDNVRPGATTPETLSEAVKLLKGEYVVRAIQQQNMDQGIIFCRTKVDCDNLESYLNQIGAGAALFSARSSFCRSELPSPPPHYLGRQIVGSSGGRTVAREPCGTL